MSWVPPSGEVIAEEIQEALEDEGIPRAEQGELIRVFARTCGNEIAALWRAIPDGEDEP